MVLTKIQLMRMFCLPQWPKSEYKASAPVVHKNTALKIKIPEGWSCIKSMANNGFKHSKIDGNWSNAIKPNKPSIENQINITGPKKRPTHLVPKR